MEQMIDPQIAPNLKTLFPNENVDFAVKAKRKIPLPFGIFRLITSLFILTIVLAFGGTIVGGILTPGKIDDGPGKYFVIGFFGLFLIVSILAVIDSLRIIFWDSTYFVGTNKRIVMLDKKNMYSRSWGKIFNNIIKMGTNEKGSIMLMPKPGVIGKDSSAMIMSGITNCDTIQGICKMRVEEASKVETTSSTVDEITPKNN